MNPPSHFDKQGIPIPAIGPTDMKFAGVDQRRIRVLTVDRLTCRRSAAVMKLPAVTTVRNVRASSVSMVQYPQIDDVDIKCLHSAHVKITGSGRLTIASA